MTSHAPSDRPVAALLPPLKNRAGSLTARLLTHGGLHRLDSGDVTINLFPGTALEGGPVQLLLRKRGPDGVTDVLPLLGPASPGRWLRRGRRSWLQGEWHGLAFAVELRLVPDASVWCWHVSISNRGDAAAHLDLLHTHDVALAPFGAIRNNEAYVSQYIDHQPLQHARQGAVVASRQNVAVGGRWPWLVIGSLARGVAVATDALQVQALARRAGREPDAWRADLPNTRLQHEHGQIAIQDEAFELMPGESTRRGFFGLFEADHPAATSTDDLSAVDRAIGLVGVRWRPAEPHDAIAAARADNLFATAPLLAVRDPDAADLAAWFGDPQAMREPERVDGRLLSFFLDADRDVALREDRHLALREGRHVALRAKELAVLRPHGHILRSGSHWTPDEAAITATVWMAGVFGSALAQGHVSINGILSTQRGYLSLFRALGQRVFVDAGEGWRLLDVPSAMEIAPRRCRWFYRMTSGTDTGTIVVTTEAHATAPELALSIEVRNGPPVRLLIVHHVALNGNDGLDAVPVRFQPGSDEIVVRPAARSAMAERFPKGRLRVRATGAARWKSTAGDSALFADGRSRSQPYLCIEYDAVREAGIAWRCELIAPGAVSTDVDFERNAAAGLRLDAPAGDAAVGIARLQAVAPWLANNALVHYLAPRGLEQFSGGGWGTRDVSQGPTEWLLALGRHDALRDLVLRVFSAQNADGDWPQWFMFFARDAAIRADDSHGDVVFWPLVTLAQYLNASGDAGILDELLPFFGADPAPLTEHVERAFAVVRGRLIKGTQLVAYGHGDWNDALQPADPRMREHLCSSWTVTLHYRTLTLLAAAWTHIGRAAEAAPWLAWRDQVLADFQRLLVVDGEVAGLASFEHASPIDLAAGQRAAAPERPATPLGGDPVPRVGGPSYLLHPRDDTTGLKHSALAMIHSIIDELFTPEQAATHLALIREHLRGPDGLRLFDKPLAYTGGLQRLFQRGESASYFGREIGLMYMHLHLRYSEALAHLGHADALFEALQLANPVGIGSLVKTAALRQSNCYYSSSDAAFADRLQASAHYDRIATGDVALEGGWRVYSSGAGIAFRLIVQCLLGLRQTHDRLQIDPVLPRSLDGLTATLLLYGREVEVTYRVGPRGHGPVRVRVDGHDAATAPLANRYRTPGVSIDAGIVRAGDRIEVEIG